MKFTALILAAIATATFVAASPVVSPVADKINEVNKDAFIPPIITKPDGDKCKICKETERDCRGVSCIPAPHTVTHLTISAEPLVLGPGH